MLESTATIICPRYRMLVLGITLLGLSACTTTSVHPITDSHLAMAAQDMAADSSRNGNSLKSLSPDQLISRGEEYLKTGNIPLAKLHFGMALQKNPESTAALTSLGIALFQEGKPDDALKPLAAALDIDPHLVKALLTTGKIMLKKGNFPEALRYLDMAHASAPANPAVLTDLAITYDSMGEEKRAEPLYKQVIALRPNQSAAYNNRGFNLLLQGQQQEAVTNLAKALQLDKNNTQARNNMAAAYALQGDEERAYALLQGTVGEAGAYNNLGYIYMTAGKFDKAEKLFKKAIEASPQFYLRSNENLQQLQRLRNENGK